MIDKTPMPTPTLSRRRLIATGLAATPAAALAPVAARAAVGSARTDRDAAHRLRALETRHDARLGVYGVNHRTRTSVLHRADERFAFCSTYKGLLVAQLLHAHAGDARFLNRIVRYRKADLIDGDFITQLYLDTGMTIRGLCEAAVSHSDNTAANLLLRLAGGPPALTRFASSLGDRLTRSDRDEPSVNTAIPGDPRDTTTPRAIGDDYARLLLGRTLATTDRTLLRVWMQGDDVNLARFRAGLPSDWTIADKTGTGDYGVANDVGVAWTGRGTPLTIAVLTTRRTQHADADSTLVASAARIVADALAPGE